MANFEEEGVQSYQFEGMVLSKKRSEMHLVLPIRRSGLISTLVCLYTFPRYDALNMKVIVYCGKCYQDWNMWF